MEEGDRRWSVRFRRRERGLSLGRERKGSRLGFIGLVRRWRRELAPLSGEGMRSRRGSGRAKAGGAAVAVVWRRKKTVSIVSG